MMHQMALQSEMMHQMTLQSDKKVPTCFNNNHRGSSTVDYVFSSNNFPQISKIDYCRLHAGSDHSALRISFKLPRYILSKKKKELLEEQDVSLDRARQGLRVLNENMDKHEKFASTKYYDGLIKLEKNKMFIS